MLDFSHPKLFPSLYHGVLSFLRITEPYMPDCVARQFGRMQCIPRDVIEPITAIRPEPIRSYQVLYDSSRWAWDSRNLHHIPLDHMGPPSIYGYECSEDYMSWYEPRTHMFISGPNAENLQSVSTYIGSYEVDAYDIY